MRYFISFCNNRFIAVVMLFVWMFTLGAGLADACITDRARSELPPFGHQSGAAATALRPVTMAAHGRDLGASNENGHDHALFHQLRCQSYQAPGPAQVARQPIKNGFDMDAVVVSIAHWAIPVPSANPRSWVRHRTPVIADLPLFIRFRRLTP